MVDGDVFYDDCGDVFCDADVDIFNDGDDGNNVM